MGHALYRRPASFGNYATELTVDYLSSAVVVAVIRRSLEGEVVERSFAGPQDSERMHRVF